MKLVAHGRLAHSAYPELGESAIETLLDVLQSVRAIKLPTDELLGPSTMNIGTIRRRPRAQCDRRSAKAEIMFRLVGSPAAHPRGLD